MSLINLFTVGGIDIRILDILDYVIAAYLIYFIYKYVKGTAAVNILVGISLFWVLLTIVTNLQMKFLSLILSSLAGIGLIGLIVIFQPEIRRVLLVIGNRTVKGRHNFFERIFRFTGIKNDDYILSTVNAIGSAVKHLAKRQIGALIVFTKSDVPALINTGQMIDARVNGELLATIFYKNTPLHDGAVIIHENRILAASCILPVSSDRTIPSNLGLRHRAALGVNESHEALALVVSEQNGSISYAYEGKLFRNVTMEELKIRLEKFYKE